jgi:hypothetical protein
MKRDNARQPRQQTEAELNKNMTLDIKNSIAGKSCRIKIWAAAVVTLAVLAVWTSSYAQPAGDTWQNLQEIVKFTQAHMADDVIITYIKTSGKTYPTGPDALLYLNSQGVSQPVLAALLGATPSAAPAPAVAITAAPETPTIDYFQAHLTPYGQWIDVPGVGSAWVPVEANNLAWRPYMNAGHWQFTDAGWFWQSDYPWGDMAFHYGRWVNNEFTGGRWAWAPGYHWAPSWVSWREGAGGMGWAPLPWGVEFRVGSGLFWHGAAVVEGVDFGLGFSAFVFVGTDHFWGGSYDRYAFDSVRARTFFEHSTFHAGYRMEGGHLMAEGLGRDHIAAITHHEVVVHKAADLRHAEETHNFAKRTEEHKELTRAPERGKEPGRSEAKRGTEGRERTAEGRERTTGAANEHETTTHSTTSGKEGNARPGAANEHETTTHSTTPGKESNTRPGAKEPTANSKSPATTSKPPAVKPKPGTTSTNQPPK